MRVYRYRRQLWLVLFVVAFVVGIVYENLTYEEYNTSIRVFDEYFLKQFVQTELPLKAYLRYVLQERLFIFLVVYILCCLKWKKWIVRGIVAWTGFLLGTLCVTAIMWRGLLGFLFCFVFLFPHSVFYAFAYAMVLNYFYLYPERRWNAKKTVATALGLSVGIILEVYVTPTFVELMVNLVF